MKLLYRPPYYYLLLNFDAGTTILKVVCIYEQRQIFEFDAQNLSYIIINHLYKCFLQSDSET